ncbi:hypothetical protein EVAR_90197_1 [Eumeta japonica]|uniref:Uncharacterized protein n=1 Tax=Eumeta variegata TaxID=151549 RepID=A0A4C1WYQ6_EUMVA|nr:hypothetical protein EVAR_90197_1 [Eumeta japonica]
MSPPRLMERRDTSTGRRRLRDFAGDGERFCEVHGFSVGIREDIRTTRTAFRSEGSSCYLSHGRIGGFPTQIESLALFIRRHIKPSARDDAIALMVTVDPHWANHCALVGLKSGSHYLKERV